jgi:hypothetical protein
MDMLVVHRPLFAKPLDNLLADEPWNKQLVEVIKAGTSVYVLGSSFDYANPGPTDALAAVLDLPEEGQLLVTKSIMPQFKVAVFTPPEAVEAVRNAMSEAGAGAAGNYSDCSFMSEGTGTFMPLEGAEPYSGEVGKLSEVKEWKLEMLVGEQDLGAVVSAMREAHPYEEVAYDIYPIMNPGEAYGIGQVYELEEETDLDTYGSFVYEAVGDESIRVYGNPDHKIRRIVVHAGDGSTLVRPAYEAGADLLITGDLSADAIEEAERLDLNLVDIRMDVIMAPGMLMLDEFLKDALADEGVQVTLLDQIVP